MNIGIDIDDTISETFETLLPYAQKYTIEELKRLPNIDMNQNFLDHFYIVKMFNWNKEEAMNFWIKYYEEILKQVNIKKFASDVIKKLKDNGNKIFLITARWAREDNNVEEITKKWLKDNNIVYDKLILGADNKVNLVKDNKIGIFIDDSYQNCKDVSENTDAKVYMMNTRVNEKFKIENVKRVYSWCELEHLINKKGEN